MIVYLCTAETLAAPPRNPAGEEHGDHHSSELLREFFNSAGYGGADWADRCRTHLKALAATQRFYQIDRFLTFELAALAQSHGIERVDHSGFAAIFAGAPFRCRYPGSREFVLPTRSLPLGDALAAKPDYVMAIGAPSPATTRLLKRAAGRGIAIREVQNIG